MPPKKPEEGMKTREKTEWSGEYKGVSWEIQKWPGYQYESFRSNKWNWTMYLYLWLDRIPENAESYWLAPQKDERFKRIHYAYSQHDVLSKIRWNGGITWYSKESGLDGMPRVIKVGCDFQHSWDHEHGDYSLDSILYHVREAVDSFREAVPEYRYWCRHDGKLHAPKEVEIFPDGEYRCGCGKAAALTAGTEPEKPLCVNCQEPESVHGIGGYYCKEFAAPQEGD